MISDRASNINKQINRQIALVDFWSCCYSNGWRHGTLEDKYHVHLSLNMVESDVATVAPPNHNLWFLLRQWCHHRTNDSVQITAHTHMHTYTTGTPVTYVIPTMAMHGVIGQMHVCVCVHALWLSTAHSACTHTPHSWYSCTRIDCFTYNQQIIFAKMSTVEPH